MVISVEENRADWFSQHLTVPVIHTYLPSDNNIISIANIEIGYMPGPLRWLGVEILNQGITGQCHIDRKLITGDSPLASNNIGKLAAQALLAEVQA